MKNPSSALDDEDPVTLLGRIDTQISRRSFLSKSATVGGAAGLGNIVGATQDQPIDEEFEFNGVIAGWIPTKPDASERTLNPTLELEAGKRYRITWQNSDGIAHNFIITDEDGDWITGTEMVLRRGESRTFEFTATEEMARYYCTVHPESMRGKITVEGTTDEKPGSSLPDDISPVDKKSSITFNKQKTKGKTVTVKSTTLPEGGFVAIHTKRIMKKGKTVRDVFKSIIGSSTYLEPGTHKNVTVNLDKNLDPGFKPGKLLIAMNHRDTNDNQQYDFVTAQADWPYFTKKGRPVIDPDIVALKEEKSKPDLGVAGGGSR